MAKKYITNISEAQLRSIVKASIRESLLKEMAPPKTRFGNAVRSGYDNARQGIANGTPKEYWDFIKGDPKQMSREDYKDEKARFDKNVQDDPNDELGLRVNNAAGVYQSMPGVGGKLARTGASLGMAAGYGAGKVANMFRGVRKESIDRAVSSVLKEMLGEADPGSIIHGTMRRQDVLPAMVNALCKEGPKGMSAARKIWKKYPDFNEALCDLECGDESNPFWTSDDAEWVYDELSDALQAFAPAGHYFGTNIGDGSDLGFWPDENIDQ